MGEIDKQTERLIKLQVLTPISVLLSIGANLVAALAVHPSLGEISDDYLTILTPRKSFVAAYWLVLYLLQIGYCVILAFARKQETRSTLVNAIGFRFVLANVTFALWTLFFALRIFLVSEICLLLTLLLMASIWIHLYWYPVVNKRRRPLDFLFIHAPMRMFLVILLSVDVWQNGLLAFRWYKYVGEEPHSPSRPGKWEGEHSKHSWIAFGVVMAVGLVNAFIVFIGEDVVWAVATVFLYIGLVLKGPKPAQIFIPLVLLSILQLVALISGLLYFKYRRDQEGAIALPEDEATPAPKTVSHHAQHAQDSSHPRELEA